MNTNLESLDFIEKIPPIDKKVNDMTDNTIIDELVKNEKKKFSFLGNISPQSRVSTAERDIFKDYDRL